MSGVIINGVQYEKCKNTRKDGTYCGSFPRIEDMFYDPPSEKFPYGRDLCPDCAAEIPTAAPSKPIYIGFGKKNK